MIQHQPSSNGDETDLDSLALSQATAGPIEPSTDTIVSRAPISIFALPKPFNQQTDTIQRNAIRSWKRLAPEVEVILMGDETGIEAAAIEMGVHHSGQIGFNEQGTPLVSSAFETAHRITRSPILVYCNADVILTQDFVRAIKAVNENNPIDRFLAIGRRTDLKVDHEIDFDSEQELESLLSKCKTEGAPATIACKEYFVFTRDLYQDVPDFAVGRGNWDNWMVAIAKENNIPVVSLSDCVTAIHQEHDYSHANKSRLQCYVNGEEARENQRLAKGRHLVSGSTSTHRLKHFGDGGVAKNRSLIPGGEFLRDLPRFAKLLLSFLR